MNDNLSPDEIRLMDEFANSAMLQGVKSKECYDLAAAMIAERRKRVPAQQVAVVLPTRRMEPPVIESTPPADGDDQLSDDELTEDNINGWSESATVAPERGDYILGEWEIDRAVALMREGLAAKASATAWGKNAAKITQERDSARGEIEKQSAVLVQWMEQTRALQAKLAAAQPVLDAVVATFQGGCTLRYGYADDAYLRQYADRRRNEERAQQQGGAS